MAEAADAKTADGKTADAAGAATLLKTPLHARHVALGARMVPFAGYDMPVQYPMGVLGEHNWTREKAGLFDVSHMGQCFLVGPDHETVARALEALIPADIVNLAPGKQRYSQLLNEDGGILDDLMVTRSADPDEDGALYLVVNAACKEADYAHIEARLPANVKLIKAEHRGLIALQGPGAEAALAKLAPEAAEMGFMTSRTVKVAGIKANVSRSGYTGEDGYEISAAANRIGEVWDTLLLDATVKPIGLGARDSLRLEAGLCLYGHDIDTTTSPIEAALNWSIQKRRREEGGFPGAARIQRELAEGPARLRVGLLPEGRAPAREGAEIATPEGEVVGTVTSGGFGPTLNGPCAMGYVARAHSAPGTKLNLIVRGKPLPAVVAPMPFVPNGYKR
ncbi:glycine cleavage system aminomethyltransferase GcvT [Bosea sp. (in: a-proteobacteria)]|uniref:glycine cleavage system aminomethyltransferase GcvT n=1 Tax=Bosea sp. (in: a-proteobacteria) TaxID=1871050 RepID=UPI00120B45C3|nr:glycine cleavage system aminomethyltransferase GcvT [Bosea sp. (in: a-proteobacteria)]TAJ29878.1 MAG: glycine cleavage system aminomethyltransferase GcvT [Bosea sp. (in: a-proteobacteria)]